MLKIENVIIEYEEKKIGPLNIELLENQIVAIIGKSGAGKSSLVKAISNTVTFKGTISLDMKQIIGSEFMYITQKGTLFQHLTIKENLELTSNIDGIEQIFKDLNLPITYLEKYPFQLSGGECQRIDLTRAILAKTKLLILDEAFSALDSKTKDDIYEILKSIQKKHKMLILFITHDLQEAIFLAHNILLINDGHVHFQGDVQNLLLGNDEIVNELISPRKMKILRSAYADIL